LRPFNAAERNHALLGQHARVSDIFINIQPNLYFVYRFSEESQLSIFTPFLLGIVAPITCGQMDWQKWGNRSLSLKSESGRKL